MKPYAYRRWRLCYIAARAIGYGAVCGALLALVAMRRIQIEVEKP